MIINRVVLLLAIVWASILAWESLAAQTPAVRIIQDGTVRQGTLSFDARASAGSFTGTTTSVTGEMKGGELTDVRGWVEARCARWPRAIRGGIETSTSPWIRRSIPS